VRSKPSHGWLEGSLDPFTAVNFDQSNKGYYAGTGTSPLTLNNYRTQTSEDYHPRAKKLWLGVVNLDYPLVWSNTT
jgi:hypothetical protein